MAHRFAELMFTPTVKALQTRHGSRDAYRRFEDPEAPSRDRFGEKEAEFIAARDSFYLASVTETGWPYVQHRGGPAGFLKLLDERTIGFADFSGNRQYVSVGNLTTDDRIAMFLMDYRNRRRLKILGHARIVDEAAEPDLMARLELPDYRARVERGIVIRLEGFDWNCPQHITPRFSDAEVEATIEPLRHRIAELERDNAALRARLAMEDRP